MISSGVSTSWIRTRRRENFSHCQKTLMTVRNSRVRRSAGVQPEEVRVMRNQDAPGLRCKVQLFEVAYSRETNFGGARHVN